MSHYGRSLSPIEIPTKNQEPCLDCAMAQAGQLSSFLHSGLPDGLSAVLSHVALAEREALVKVKSLALLENALQEVPLPFRVDCVDTERITPEFKDIIERNRERFL